MTRLLGWIATRARLSGDYGAAIVGLFGIFILWGGLSWSLSVQRQTAIRNAFDDTNNYARALQEQTAGIVRAIDQTLLYARASYLRAPDRFDIRQWSEHGAFQTNSAFQLAIIDQDGQLRASSLGPITRPIDLSDRKHFRAQAASSDDHLFIGEPVTLHMVDKWAIQFTRRMVGPDGAFLGVVSVSLDPSYLTRFYDSLHLGGEAALVLVGTDAIIRARAPNEPNKLGHSLADTPIMGLFAEHPNGSLNVFSPIDGVKRIFSYRAVEGYPLLVVVGMSERDVLAKWSQDQHTYLTTAGALTVVLLFVMISLILHQRRSRRLRKALRESRERLQLASEAARVGIWDWDVATNKLVWDDRMYQLYGIRRNDFSGANDAWRAGLHPDDRAKGDAAITAAIDRFQDFNIEFRVMWPNGEVHDIEARALVQRAVNGQATRMVGVNLDITERKRAEQALLSSETKFRDLFESMRDAVLLVDPSSCGFTSTNPSAVALFGATHERELLSLKPWELSPERQPDGRSSAEKAHAMIETALREGAHAFEWTHRRIDGVEFPADVLLTRVGRGQNVVVHCMVRDISDRKLAEQQILRMARHDKLTGLANRHVFVDALEQAIGRARRDDESFAVLYLDLDHFKDVNDTLGHPVGDSLLCAVAERLLGCVRATDTIARFGGDEFAVLVDDVRDPASLTIVADRLLRVMGEPFVIDGNMIRSGTSVGIAVFGLDSSDAVTLLSHADVALYRAKAEGRGSYRFFTEAMDMELRARIVISAELREAVATEQFFLLYQPQIEIATGRIVGLEALVRWNHPTKGVLGPGRFIAAAEKNGLIVSLGRWVLRDACHQTRQWLDAGIAPRSVAINLSAIQFKSPLELEKDIATTVAEAGLPPRLLELELTESVLMGASRDHNEVLLRLREKGHRMAIDDFGSGYSSLDYLRRYPVDRIKIAQTFIADIGIEPGNDAIVRAALGLARELGIEVVVEGVETAAQLALLKTWGARIVQGYYYARPMTVPDVTALLRVGKFTPALVEPLEPATG